MLMILLLTKVVFAENTILEDVFLNSRIHETGLVPFFLRLTLHIGLKRNSSFSPLLVSYNNET